MPNLLIEANKRIQALGAARRLDAALSEFHGLKKSGLKASLVTYNVILYACVRCGAVDQALEIFASQRSLAATIPALVPNVVTYTTVLKGLCQSARIREAWNLLKEAANTVELNARAVNMFLRGCLWHGYPSEALECYGSLGKWAVIPDRVTVDYTVRLLSSALRIPEACSLLAGLPRHVTPDPGTVLSVALACALAGKPNRARRFLADAEDNLASNSQPFLVDDRDRDEEGPGDKSAHMATYLAHKREEVEGDMKRIQTFLDERAPLEEGESETALLPSKKRRRDVATDRVATPAPQPHAITDLTDFYCRTFLFRGDFSGDCGTPRNAVVESVWEGLCTLGCDFMLKHRAAVEAGLASQLQKRVKCAFSKDTVSPDGTVTSFPRLRWSKVFRSPAGAVHPETWMEICSGSGDWIVHQAKAHRDRNWVAVELKHHRLTSIFSKAVCAGVDNLAILGGDAKIILNHFVKPHSVTHAVVNFPEPPAAHDKADHLCDAALFKLISTVLVPNGTVTVVTDNTEYAALVLKGAKLACKSSNLQLVSDGVAAGIPPEFSVDGTTGSYFDRLWSSRSKVRRYHIQLANVGVE